MTRRRNIRAVDVRRLDIVVRGHYAGALLRLFLVVVVVLFRQEWQASFRVLVHHFEHRVSIGNFRVVVRSHNASSNVGNGIAQVSLMASTFIAASASGVHVMLPSSLMTGTNRSSCALPSAPRTSAGLSPAPYAASNSIKPSSCGMAASSL